MELEQWWLKMNFDSLVKNLEELIETSAEQLSIPYARGNSIRIKNYVVRKNKDGYLVYDCKDHKRISELSFKVSALAVAKTLSEGNNVVKQIETLDRSFLKHYNDVLFFKNTIKNTDSTLVKETRRTRLDLSLQKAQIEKQKLEDFIF